MELPAFLSAVAMRVRHWSVCSATSASSAPTGPVPETWMWLPMRTAREKPMMGSKGDVPGMLVRLVMGVACLVDLVRDRARLFFYFNEQGTSDLAGRECERHWFPTVGRLISQAGKVYRAERRFLLRVSRVFRGLGRELPAIPPWYSEA